MLYLALIDHSDSQMRPRLERELLFRRSLLEMPPASVATLAWREMALRGGLVFLFSDGSFRRPCTNTWKYPSLSLSFLGRIPS